MNFYQYKNKFLMSFDDYDFEKISYDEFIKTKDTVFFLRKMDPKNSRRSFLITDSSLLLNKEEDVSLLKTNSSRNNDPYIENIIAEKRLVSLNTNYPSWEDLLVAETKNKYKVNLLALGDVGSNLAIGLRLLGGDSISSLNLYDRNKDNLNRWLHELNQIIIPFEERKLPVVNKLDYEELFDCDIFVFCASKGIPSVGSGVKDVRMAQFESNSKIISEYARLAREKDFKGIFAVVSDPVDLLCKVALVESNKNDLGELDYRGLAPEQIIGYGLGVMNARASFYSKELGFYDQYVDEGRVFGPHGEGLICANSIENYNDDLSKKLTDSVISANLVIRDFGYKPYIAPSLSSGSISLIHTLESKWFYGSTYMGSAYIGSRCRFINNTIELERLDLDGKLYNRIKDTSRKLADIV